MNGSEGVSKQARRRESGHSRGNCLCGGGREQRKELMVGKAQLAYALQGTASLMKFTIITSTYEMYCLYGNGHWPRWLQKKFKTT